MSSSSSTRVDKIGLDSSGGCDIGSSLSHLGNNGNILRRNTQTEEENANQIRRRNISSK
jgi:hypothetical protein